MIHIGAPALWRGVILLVVACGVLGVLSSCCRAKPEGPAVPYFRITVVDEATGRGIPLVRLRTANSVEYWTDSAGVGAFYEPDLMDKEVVFSVDSYGYSRPTGGSGRRGIAFRMTPGGSGVVKMRRENIAQRLYRITGAGIYRESLLLGDDVPPTQDPSPSPVLGQDSVATAVYKGKIFWIWGDTSFAGFPRWNFKVTAATSELPSRGGLDPEVGVFLKYFRLPEGQVKPMANMEHRGPIWLGQLRVGLEESGRERLFAPYFKIEPGGSLRTEESGWVVFDDEAEVFNFVCTTEEFDAAKGDERGWHEHGGLRWRWKETTDPRVEKQMERLAKAGQINLQKPLSQLRDVLTGNPVVPHAGTVGWNAYRKRWIMIRCQQYGLGELWYFEGDTPQGPWVYGQKVISHWRGERDNYSFYNPFHHPEFDKEGGRVIFFEGTYTRQFSAASHPTPYYDYNQIMYKLELDDPRLFLPAAVYRVGGGVPSYRTKTQIPEDNLEREIVWYAPDRPREGTIPIYEYVDEKRGTAILTADKPGGQPASAAFYGLAVTEAELSPEMVKMTAPLNEFVDSGSGKRLYTTSESVEQPGFKKSAAPVCRVWRKPE
jgi:hypothetical protein